MAIKGALTTMTHSSESTVREQSTKATSEVRLEGDGSSLERRAASKKLFCLVGGAEKNSDKYLVNI